MNDEYDVIVSESSVQPCRHFVRQFQMVSKNAPVHGNCQSSLVLTDRMISLLYEFLFIITYCHLFIRPFVKLSGFTFNCCCFSGNFLSALLCASIVMAK